MPTLPKGTWKHHLQSTTVDCRQWRLEQLWHKNESSVKWFVTSHQTSKTCASVTKKHGNSFERRFEMLDSELYNIAYPVELRKDFTFVAFSLEVHQHHLAYLCRSCERAPRLEVLLRDMTIGGPGNFGLNRPC